MQAGEKAKNAGPVVAKTRLVVGSLERVWRKFCPTKLNQNCLVRQPYNYKAATHKPYFPTINKANSAMRSACMHMLSMHRMQ